MIKKAIYLAKAPNYNMASNKATIIHIPFLQGHPPKIKYHKKKTNCLEVLLSTKPKRQKASCQGQYSLVLAHFKHIARNTFNHKSSPQNKE